MNPDLSKLPSIDRARIDAFCRRWALRELALFGSVTTKDFGPDSDIDVLVTFDSEAEPTLLDLVDMEDELAGILGRPIDLLERNSIRNPFFRSGVMEQELVIYAA